MAYRTPSGPQLQQGDILTDVRSFSMQAVEDEGKTSGILRVHTYSVVVTQDCDLEQDYGARFPSSETQVSSDKRLFGILMCGAYDADLLKAGKHRHEAKTFGKKEWKPVERNQDPRYQYLGFVGPLGRQLVADFKDYFMIPCDFIYAELSASRVARKVQMDTPWKEHLLQRFAWYLMRVGLPVDFHNLDAGQNNGQTASP